MSEADEHDPDRGHSTVTDPRGTVGAGESDLAHYSTGAPPARTLAEQTAEERAYNRNLYGLTYRERYGQRAQTCVCHCLQPGQRRRGVRCCGCYGPVEIRAFTEDADVEPGPGKADRFAAWVGGWVGAFAEAMLFPFRVGRAHTHAVIRDILQESAVEISHLDDILTTLEGIEQELRAIRGAADRAGEALCQDGPS